MNTKIIILFLLIAAVVFIQSGCSNSSNTPLSSETSTSSTQTEHTTEKTTAATHTELPPTPTETQTLMPSQITPTKSASTEPTPDPISYPWNEMDMFFGWSIIGRGKIPFVRDLDMKWASLQPHVIWFEIEKEKGEYDWTKLDTEIGWLQRIDVDITLVYSTFSNVFDEAIRNEIRAELLSLIGDPGVNTVADAWFKWNRDLHGPERYGLEPDPFNEDDEMMARFIEFVKALTERYDGDGKDDWSGLRYPVRVHHIVEEWPSPGLNVKTYLGYLSKLSPAIKEVDPNAQVMIPGLYMPNWGRVYAYLEGYIDDDDAGIIKGIRYTKEELSDMPGIVFGKKAYETILDLGRDYFDIVDIHLYTEKETFYEGEIEYVREKMRELGYEKPIWCVEGGGPFRNPVTSPDDPQGDRLFGTTNEKEVAEYVVKFHAMSAAEGLIRQHWGISGQTQLGYWGGPWNIMGLIEKVTGKKRPAYYTYKLMREKLRDFVIGNVSDLSIGNIRIFMFNTQRGEVFVVWDRDIKSNFSITDLSDIFGNRDVEITGIITELDEDDNPVIHEVVTIPASKIPLSNTPVFIE